MTPQPSRFPDDALRALQGGEAGPDDVLALLREHRVAALRLQFTDLAGAARYVDVPAARFAEALDGAVPFEGSRAGGPAGVEEAEVLLRPDATTLCLLPLSEGRVARALCDVQRADGTPWEGDPRGVLRRAVHEAEEAGYRPRAAAEAEFHLLDAGSVSLAPADAVRGERARQATGEALLGAGVEVASAHPETAPGQHEIALLPADPLALADGLVTLREAARAVARAHGLRATFMPKPVFGQSGSGLHLHHLLLRNGEDAFADAEAPGGLSAALRGFVGGVLRHARGFAAITNPLVNSYKRLVPGYAAPLYASWSQQEATSLVRVPPPRGAGVRCEVRLADGGANPYLAVAVQLAAGLDGIRSEADPGTPVSRQSGTMRGRELQRRRIPLMPQHLGEALAALEEDRVVRSALGEYVYSHFVEVKRAEWEEYAAQVHAWEIDRYLDV